MRAIFAILLGALAGACTPLPLDLATAQRRQAAVAVTESRLYLEVRPERNLLLGRWYAKVQPQTPGGGRWFFQQSPLLAYQSLRSGERELEYRFYPAGVQGMPGQRPVAVLLPETRAGGSVEVSFLFFRRLDPGRPAGTDLRPRERLDLGPPSSWMPAAEQQPAAVQLQLLVAAGLAPQETGVFGQVRPLSGAVLYEGVWPASEALLLLRSGG